MIFNGENWYSITYYMSDGLVILSTDWFVGEIRKRRGPSPVVSSPSPVSASELPRIQLWRCEGDQVMLYQVIIHRMSDIYVYMLFF